MFHRFYFYLLFCLLLFSCQSEEKKKEDLSLKIAQESCEKISKVSSNILGGLVSGILNSIAGSSYGIEPGSLGKIPDNWCSCYCNVVSNVLRDKYSSKELEEIYNDKNLQYLLIVKIVELKKNELQTCIVESTNQKLNEYNELKTKLDGKN